MSRKNSTAGTETVICKKSVRYGYSCIQQSNEAFYPVASNGAVFIKAFCLDNTPKIGQPWCLDNSKCRPVKITVEFIKKIPKGR